MAVLHRLLMLAWGGIPDPVQASLDGSRLPVTPLPNPQPDYAISGWDFKYLE
jgi:hypothetical protein